MVLPHQNPEMDPQVKVLASKPAFDPLDPHGGRRETTLPICPLTPSPPPPPTDGKKLSKSQDSSKYAVTEKKKHLKVISSDFLIHSLHDFLGSKIISSTQWLLVTKVTGKWQKASCDAHLPIAQSQCLYFFKLFPLLHQSYNGKVQVSVGVFSILSYMT